MIRKRKTDVINERAEMLEQVMEVETEQYADDIAHNPEGVSAEFAKYPLDETTTPKILPANKDA